MPGRSDLLPCHAEAVSLHRALVSAGVFVCAANHSSMQGLAVWAAAHATGLVDGCVRPRVRVATERARVHPVNHWVENRIGVQLGSIFAHSGVRNGVAEKQPARNHCEEAFLIITAHGRHKHSEDRVHEHGPCPPNCATMRGLPANSTQSPVVCSTTQRLLTPTPHTAAQIQSSQNLDNQRAPVHSNIIGLSHTALSFECCPSNGMAKWNRRP